MIKEKITYLCVFCHVKFFKKQVTEKCIEIKPVLQMHSLKKGLN